MPMYFACTIFVVVVVIVVLASVEYFLFSADRDKKFLFHAYYDHVYIFYNKLNESVQIN